MKDINIIIKDHKQLGLLVNISSGSDEISLWTDGAVTIVGKDYDTQKEYLRKTILHGETGFSWEDGYNPDEPARSYSAWHHDMQAEDDIVNKETS